MTEPTLLLEARDVVKRFGAVTALRAASLEVRSGEVHGLMGANGAGKSTLVKIVTGVYPADKRTNPGQGRLARLSLASARRATPASCPSIRIPPWCPT